MTSLRLALALSVDGPVKPIVSLPPTRTPSGVRRRLDCELERMAAPIVRSVGVREMVGEREGE